MLFDSHAHYNDSKFDEDRIELLSSMPQNNVGLIMNAADSVASVKEILSLCDKFPFIYGSCGVHPENTMNMTDDDIDILRNYTNNEKIKAIGEIGLDYYWDDVPRDIQKKWFIKQLELANEVDLPVIIHDRDAHGDTVDILRQNMKTGGVLHCFSGSREMARDVLDMGMYIAFGGTATFKNARRVQEVLEYVPMDRIMIETDCPYLAPEPHRGKKNSSLYIHYVCEKIAEIKGITAKEVEEITFENAKKCYKIQ